RDVDTLRPAGWPAPPKRPARRGTRRHCWRLQHGGRFVVVGGAYVHLLWYVRATTPQESEVIPEPAISTHAAAIAQVTIVSIAGPLRPPLCFATKPPHICR